MLRKSINGATNTSFLSSVAFAWRRPNLLFSLACVHDFHLYVAPDFVSPELSIHIFFVAHPDCSTAVGKSILQKDVADINFNITPYKSLLEALQKVQRMKSLKLRRL